MLIARTLERLLEWLTLWEEGDDAKVVVGVAVAELVTELTVAEADAILLPEVADVVDMGGVPVKRAFAAVGITPLASPLMRLQKSGRRPD